MPKLAEDILKNSVWNAFVTFLSKLGGMVFIFIIARILLSEKFGIYSLALAVSIFVLSISNNAINQAVLRYISEAMKNNNKSLASASYRFLFRIKFIISIASALALIILAYPLSAYIFHKPELFLPLILSSIYLFVLSMQNFYEMIFYNIRKVNYLSIKEAIIQSSKIILVLLLLFFVGKRYYLPGVFASLIFASLFGLLYMLYYLKKKTRFIFSKQKAEVDKKRIINFILFSASSEFSRTVLVNIDIILIGIFLVASFAGYYSAAFAIVGGLYSFILLTNILIPIFTNLYKKQLSLAFNRVSKYTAIISIPIIFGLISLGKYLLRGIYGYEYLPAALPMYFLSIMIFETPFVSALISVFLARQQPAKVTKITSYAIIINLVLNLIFIPVFLKISPLWTVTSIVIIGMISRIFVLFSLAFIAHRKFQIDFEIKEILKAALAGAIMALLIIAVNSQISDMTLAKGILIVLFGALVYIFLLILLKSLKKEDYLLLKSLIPKFKKSKQLQKA